MQMNLLATICDRISGIVHNSVGLQQKNDVLLTNVGLLTFREREDLTKARLTKCESRYLYKNTHDLAFDVEGQIPGHKA